jgi:hypothetical protein
MGDLYWLGTADAVAQISTATPALVEINDVFDLLINGEIMATYTATAGTVANVTAGLTAAWNTARTADDANVWMSDIVATDSGPGNNITLTASTKGLPFVVTSDTTDGGGNDTWQPQPPRPARTTGTSL